MIRLCEAVRSYVPLPASSPGSATHMNAGVSADPWLAAGHKRAD